MTFKSFFIDMYTHLKGVIVTLVVGLYTFFKWLFNKLFNPPKPVELAPTKPEDTTPVKPLDRGPDEV